MDENQEPPIVDNLVVSGDTLPSDTVSLDELTPVPMFELGQQVKHKLSNKRLIVIQTDFDKKRRVTLYACRDENYNIFDFYEFELK